MKSANNEQQQVPTIPPRGPEVRGPAGSGPRPVPAAALRRIRLIGEALFSTADDPPPLARLDWLVVEMEDFLGRSGRFALLLFTVMLWATTLLAPLFIRRLSTFENLDRSERVRALSELERRFGEPLIAIKAILCLVYYEHPDAAREVGFDGQCLISNAEVPR